MKALGFVAALAVVGFLIVLMISDPEPEQEPTQPPPVEVVEVEPDDPSLLALPDDVELIEGVEEVSMEEAKPKYEEVDKPKIISRRFMADGRLEVKMLTPVFFGNGEKKTMIRTVRARPTMMKRSDTRQRPTDKLGRGQNQGGGKQDR